MSTQPELKPHLLKGVLLCSFAAGYQPHFVDENSFSNDFSTPLLVHCSGSMPRSLQQKLAHWIQEGGRALLTPCIPAYDEYLEPCTILADALGCTPNSEKMDSFCGARLYSILGLHPITGKAESFPAIPPVQAEILGTSDGKCVAYSIQAARGKMIWLGLNFILESNKQIKMWQGLFQRLGLKARWTCDNPWLMTVRRRTSRGIAIFVSNLGSSRQQAHATYQGREFDLELAPMEVRYINS